MTNTLITQIREENRRLLNPLSRYGMRVTSERMYPDPFTFIRELIQNSDDAYYKINKAQSEDHICIKTSLIFHF